LATAPERISRRRAMPIEDDDRPRKKISHEIGQDLSLLSLEELIERIALLRSEIERLEAASAKKRASKDAANSFFKSKRAVVPAKPPGPAKPRPMTGSARAGTHTPRLA